MSVASGATRVTITLRPEAAVVEAIRRFFRDDPARTTMMAARRFAVAEQAVLEAMADDWPVVALRPRCFRDAMDGLPALGTTKVLVRNHAAVIEAIGSFGGYSEAGPFFHVQTDSLEMHIQPAEVASVYAIERDGGASLQFFDRAGEAAFKVFLWEPGGGGPAAERLEAFRGLVRQLSTPAEPSFPPPPAAPVTVPAPGVEGEGEAAAASASMPMPPLVAPTPAPPLMLASEGGVPGGAAAVNKLIGSATTTDVATPPPPLPADVRAFRIGVRVAAVLGVLTVVLLLAGLFVAPLFWRHYEHHPRLVDAPKIVQTTANVPDLPLNVGLVGEDREVYLSLLEAGWDPADPGTFTDGNRWPVTRKILQNRPYPPVEMEPRTLFGRNQDYAFVRKAAGGERRLLRLWRSTDYSMVGRPFWFGTAWAERPVKSAADEGQAGAARWRLDPDVDATRDALIADLSTALRLTEVLRATGAGPMLSGKTSEGRAYYTDGELSVGLVPVGTRPHDRPPTLRPSPLLVRIKDSIWSELAPLVAGDEGS